ncbi:MAG TPA: sigma-70 family RNA polymerase sigma factor [Thermoanaerobaculia bacterium]|nr:sigma-70 family RNA polymerase sigma factor [Thermoanaerobaculia bacterium]
MAFPDPTNPAGDLALVRAVAAGDQGAVAALWDRHAPVLLGLARRVLKDPADAEEVVQEAFLHLWRQAGRYDPSRASVPTWLALVTRSRAIDRLRTRGVVDRAHAAAGKEAGPGHASGDGAARVLHAERAKRVRAELAAIPEEQRRVLELAFFEGLTQAEIAERIDIPLGTVKTRTLLAMKKLRTALRDEIRELL